MNVTIHPYRPAGPGSQEDSIHLSVPTGRMRALVGRRVAGTFCTGGIRQVAGAFHLAELELSDYSGAVTAIVPCQASRHITLPDREGFATAVGRVTHDAGNVQLRIQLLRPSAGLDSESAANLLCRPGEETIHRKLRGLERALPWPLRQFLVRVLLDPKVQREFLSCRASVAHHHSNAGGLIEHALDNMDLLGAVIERTLPGDTLSIGIAKLAYALHDIGKLWTVGTTARPWMSRVLPHEQANFLILAPHLDWLKEVFPEAWAGLVAILSHLATPAPLRKRPKYFPAEVVATFDGWSAATFSKGGIEKLTAEIPNGADGGSRRWELVRAGI